MLRLISKREKIILYTTIGMAIFAIAFKFAILPVIDRYDAITGEIEIASAKLNKYRQLLVNKKVIEEKYIKLFGSLPEPKELTANPLFELESLARASGVRIVDIRPQAGSGAKEAIIDLRADGLMEAYLKFIYNIENSTAFFSIKKLQLISKPNTQGLEGNFSILQSAVAE